MHGVHSFKRKAPHVLHTPIWSVTLILQTYIYCSTVCQLLYSTRDQTFIVSRFVHNRLSVYGRNPTLSMQRRLMVSGQILRLFNISKILCQSNSMFVRHSVSSYRRSPEKTTRGRLFDHSRILIVQLAKDQFRKGLSCYRNY